MTAQRRADDRRVEAKRDAIKTAISERATPPDENEKTIQDRRNDVPWTDWEL